MTNFKHIEKQIAGLGGLLYSIRRSTNWGKEYGTYAPLERQVTELKDTMQAMLDVVRAAEAEGIHKRSALGIALDKLKAEKVIDE